MKETKERFFYLWKNHLGRTCFGITSNPDSRRRKYEGHCGYAVCFDALWCGPDSLIEDLEDQFKTEFWEYLLDTDSGKYEWVLETIAFQNIVGWINWEIENTYNKRIVNIHSPEL